MKLGFQQRDYLMSKRLLYLSTHETLEFDELRIFTDLGFDCFSIGYWMNPHAPATKIRPAIPNMVVHQDLIDKFKVDYPDYKLPKAEFNTGDIRLNKDFLDNFDVIVNCWYSNNLKACLNNCDKPVVHRTIDMMNTKIEEHLIHLYVRSRPFYLIRMNEVELTKNKTLGVQAIIKQCVEQDKFYGWHGNEAKIFTNIKGAKKRPDISFDLYDFTTQGHNRILVGSDNDGIAWAKQGVSQEELLSTMQACRVNYVQPRIGAAMIYSFVEAMMVGCPVVTYGTKYNGSYWQAGKFIKNGINGYCVNSHDEAFTYIDRLMKDKPRAEAMSREARKTALAHFDYSVAAQQWKKFFQDIKVLTNE
jgi:hypothetical protein